VWFSRLRSGLGGVLGVLPGLLGTFQAAEAIKLIVGAAERLVGTLLLGDALDVAFRWLTLRRDPACPVCGGAPTIRELIDYEHFCGLTPPASASTAAPAPVPEISVEELQARIQDQERLWILDVREPNEFDICRIPGSTLIPLGELPRRLAELPDPAEAPTIVVHCKMGGRSAKAVTLLREHGVRHAVNLRGGILAWIDRVDPALPKY
jgi:adenylyltransferase/sulfurtransferase